MLRSGQETIESSRRTSENMSPTWNKSIEEEKSEDTGETGEEESLEESKLEDEEARQREKEEQKKKDKDLKKAHRLTREERVTAPYKAIRGICRLTPKRRKDSKLTWERCTTWVQAWCEEDRCKWHIQAFCGDNATNKLIRHMRNIHERGPPVK